jgi:hypothetical protein
MSSGNPDVVCCQSASISKGNAEKIHSFGIILRVERNDTSKLDFSDENVKE